MNWRDEILVLTRFNEIVLRLLKEDASAEDKEAILLGLKICAVREAELKAHSGRKPRETRRPNYDMPAFQVALRLALKQISRKEAIKQLASINDNEHGDDSTEKRQLADMKAAAETNAHFLRWVMAVSVQKKT